MLCNVVAMENWGLITFEERLLLVDPVNTAQSSRQYTANVVGKQSQVCREYFTLSSGHELAHQWFGNLVSSCVT